MAFVPMPIVISNSVQQMEQSCERTLKSFDPKTATTKEQIGYSDCVQLLYPKEIAQEKANEGVFLLFIFIVFFTVVVALFRKTQEIK